MKNFEQNQRILDELKNGFRIYSQCVCLYRLFSCRFEELFTFYPGENFSDRQGSRSYLFATSQVNECLYCLSAHTFMAKAIGFTEEQIIELRKGKVTFDSRLNVLTALTREIVEKRGKIGEENLKNFYAAGYKNEKLVDVILLISSGNGD